MKSLKRSLLKIGLNIYAFNERYLPPAVLDSGLSRKIFKILFGKNEKIFLDFKSNAAGMNPEEFSDVYRQLKSDLHRDKLGRETDMSDKVIYEILKNIVGENVLEVGCGSGFLARKIAQDHKVTASDIFLDPKKCTDSLNLEFIEANVEKLPFKKDEFDTVVCAHTLEHVRDILSSISELRRVAKRRLIIVVPKQRPYKYTFDLHLHFFPYTHSLLILMGPNRKNSCKDLGMELVYIEDM